MATSQSLLGLVSQLHSMDEIVNSMLMEMALKLSSLTDASVFVLVETQEGRKFAGKRHLCDAYLQSRFTPLANDLEMEFDPTVSALHHRRPSNSSNNSINNRRPKHESNEFGIPVLFDEQQQQQQQEQQQQSRRPFKTQNLRREDRKRLHSGCESPQELRQPQQQQHKKLRRSSQDELGAEGTLKREEGLEQVVKREAEESVIAVIDDDVEGVSGSGGLEMDSGNVDNDVIVEEYPPLASSRSDFVGSENVNGGSGGGGGIGGGGGDGIRREHPHHLLGNRSNYSSTGSDNLYDYGGTVACLDSPSNGGSFVDGGVNVGGVGGVGGLIDGGGGVGGSGFIDDAQKRFPDKLKALEGFSLHELAGQHPIASKIFKSCLYDFSKTVATDFVASLAATGKPYASSEGNAFIRHKFQLWTRQQPLIQTVYSSGMKLNSKRPDGNTVSSDSTMWNYVRNAFSINLKRQLRIASLKDAE